MKKILLSVLLVSLASCHKNEESTSRKMADSLKIIDSINAARTKHNDSVLVQRQKNIFGDLSGIHPLKFENDIASLSGNLNFEKIGRDLYHISGSAKSGNNNVSIEGELKRVSEIHLNFDGKISQTINGKDYLRTKKTTFLREGNAKYWRLQNKINNEGFIDYIDIY